jgi:Phosphotransferase enzyme family
VSSRNLAATEGADGVLWELVRDLFSGPGRAPIAAVSRQPFQASTSYRSEVVTVHLADGSSHRLFLKDFGFTRLPKAEPAARRDRELLVYERLLAAADLGTPAYLGHVWDQRERRFWLLLEFVEGSPLRHAHFDWWLAAAGWLGRMQVRFRERQRELERCSGLERHDASYFVSIGDAALSAVSAYRQDLGEQLAVVLDGYEQLCRGMASRAATLVHGSYRPANILVCAGPSGPRICPTDWELAAFGSPLYDLAFIADGFEPPLADLLVDAYRREAEAGEASAPDHASIRRDMACFRLHKVLKSLSRCLGPGFPEPTVRKLVRMAELSRAAVDT